MLRIVAVFAVLGVTCAPTCYAADEPKPDGQTQSADGQTADGQPPYAAPQQPVVDVEVKHRSFIKRKIDAFFVDDDGVSSGGFHVGPFAPRLDFVSSGSGAGPTLHLWLPDIGNTPISFHASAHYSMLKYQYYDAQFGLVPHEGEHLPRNEKGTTALFPLSDLEKTSLVPGFNIYVSARYRDYPREDFYGIGAASSIPNHTDYRLQDGMYEGIVRFRVSHVSFMARAGLLKTAILAGEDSAFTNTEVTNDESTAPGLTRAPDFIHMSAGTWLEWRDEPGNAHRGVALGAAFSRFDARAGEPFSFNRVAAEAREYISLGSKRHVLALREAAVLDSPDAGSRVPFYLQAVLGGSTYVRGFGSFRFRDDNLLALTAEYRFELRPKIELALIYDGGEVFPTRSDFESSGLRHSYGIGLRLKSPRKVRVLVDVMHSTEGTRVIAKFRPSF